MKNKQHLYGTEDGLNSLKRELKQYESGANKQNFMFR